MEKPSTLALACGVASIVLSLASLVCSGKFLLNTRKLDNWTSEMNQVFRSMGMKESILLESEEETPKVDSCVCKKILLS